MEAIAKLFQNGRSQAVLLPKAFRFKGTEVRIIKKGKRVILRTAPLPPEISFTNEFFYFINKNL
jgi:antitoxin VapB